MIDPQSILKITAYLSEPSKISHHGASCCSRARGWLMGLDAVSSKVAGVYEPPLWLRRHYGWAPHPWPLFWCQIPLIDDLDCGSLAALATEIYKHRGDSVFQVQLALEYPVEAIRVWGSTWRQTLGHSDWISDTVCYHEACALPSRDGEIFLWDPTEGRWITPHESVNHRYGRLLALRLFGEQTTQALFFHGKRIVPGEWASLFEVETS